jgi:hypothetical protein
VLPLVESDPGAVPKWIVVEAAQTILPIATSSPEPVREWWLCVSKRSRHCRFPQRANITQTGERVGPANFQTPETREAHCSIDAQAADVYSLAASLWASAAGGDVSAAGSADGPPEKPPVERSGLDKLPGTPRSSWRQRPLITENLSRPAEIVLPCVKEITRSSKIVLVALPHHLADVKDAAGASQLAQRFNDPSPQRLLRSHETQLRRTQVEHVGESTQCALGVGQREGQVGLGSGNSDRPRSRRAARTLRLARRERRSGCPSTGASRMTLSLT